MMMVPEPANMPPTPWQTEILAPGLLLPKTPKAILTPQPTGLGGMSVYISRAGG
jgi:hypothetical protein